MPEPVLTIHVQQRMEQRGISKEQIYTALAHEVRRTPGQPGSIWIYGLVNLGETLKVCISADNARIITAAWPD